MTKKAPREFVTTYMYIRDVNLREHPMLYQVGRGEQGVLTAEPYKSEILPLWRFKTPEIAQKSADKIFAKFLQYKRENDFIGMDMARKFLQMGYTRSRRYANHASGRKYAKNPQNELTFESEKEARKNILPFEKDSKTNEKAQSAEIFLQSYHEALADEDYQRMKKKHNMAQKEFMSRHKGRPMEELIAMSEIKNAE